MSLLLRKFFPRRSPQSARDLPTASGITLDAPHAAIYAVGDVHGRLDLYRQIEARIAEDDAPQGEKLIVLLGDIVDRGPDSAGMIDLLLARPAPGIGRLCLLGNHEDMATRFFANPDPASEWLAHGGAEMLVSYGIARDPTALAALSRKDLAMRIATHIPQEHFDFLDSRPLFARVGPYFLCHAGVDPLLPLTRQDRFTLLWSRRFQDPESPPPPDLPPGGFVVQGHMPIDRAEQRDWRINVDTGAYMTGRLSAVRLGAEGAPHFISVGN